MTDTLRDLLKQQDATKFATESGLRAHRNMQMIVIDDDIARGDPDIIAKIKSHPELLPFFVATAQTEVPVAGIIRGRFISRRIDRMVADHDKHQIIVMDYKTDVSPDKFHDRCSRNIDRNEYGAHATVWSVGKSDKDVGRNDRAITTAVRTD